MGRTFVNDQNSWSIVGHLWIVTRVFGPKVRAQNEPYLRKRSKKLVDFCPKLGVTEFNVTP